MSSLTGLEHQRLLPATLEARLLGLLARGAGFFLLLAIALAWTSIITWSVTDPSLTHSTGGEARNALGAAGAIVSDLVLETLGLGAAIALLAPMFWSIELAGSERIRDVRTRIALYPLCVLTFAAALSSLPVTSSWPMEHGLGGILGDVIFNFTAALFSLISPERASLATGALFSLTGVSMLGQALGLERADLRAFLPARSKHPTATGEPWSEPTLETIPAPRPSMWAERPWSPARIGAFMKRRVVAEPTFAPYHPEGTPALEPQPGRPFVADGDRAAQSDAHAPMAHEQSAHIMDDELGPFDPAVEHSSRAIAERFAPANRPLQPGGGPGIAERFAAHFPREAPRPEPQPQAKPQRNTAPFRMPAKPSLMGRLVVEGRGEEAYKRPQPGMLKRSPAQKTGPEFSQTALRGTARLLEDVLSDFGVKGEVRDVKPGPVVTLFELEPARGTKASRVMALSDDIARSMSAKSARVAVIPGRNAIGIELPNARRDSVGLRELLESQAFIASDGALPLALGKAIGGEPVVADLARMPHLLVAGTTGSGKSVGVNAMILSILFRHTPEDCRFLMIDPKMLELSVYNGIPHLLAPVVTEPQKAVSALNWAVSEMEERYKRMAKLSVRNIEAFNARVKSAKSRGEPLARTVQTGFDQRTGRPMFEREEIALEPMPYIIIVVDEFADLMITAGKDIETAVQRLAQKARAAGIHLIMATQRPSVDIITGTIKANFPTRISFKVASKIDSRTILNDHGAEQLLGQGDMLFAAGSGQTVRVHGPYVSDEEVEAIADYLRSQGEPRYVDVIGPDKAAADEPATAASADGHDSLYDRAVALVLRDRKASTSYVQRRLAVGYNRAADLIERMEREGIISPPNQTGRREIFAGEPAPAANA